MSLADEIAAVIRENGRLVTLRRLTGTPRIPTIVEVYAVVTGYQPHQLVGSIVEADRQVIIGNTEILARKWPGPPVVTDEVEFDGATYSIAACDTKTVAGEIVRHDMRVRGGG